MSDITLDTIVSGYNLASINENFVKIETAINDEILHITGGNNTLQQTLNANSQRIYNLSDAVSASEPVTLGQIGNFTLTTEFVSTVTEDQTATDGQQVFTLTSAQYTPGVDNISVYINGSHMSTSTYAQTAGDTITMNTGSTAGDEYAFVVNQRNVSGDTIPASSVTYTPVGTDAIPTNVAAKLDETISVLSFPGVDRTGVTSSHTGLNSAIEYCKDNGRALYVPAGTYLCNESLFTGVTLAQEAAGGKGLKGLYGEATDLTIFKFATTSSTDHGIDNTGGRYQNFANFTIEGDVTNPPKVGLLMARVDRDATAGNAPSASEGWYDNIEIRGYFGSTSYYNYGAEATRFTNCTFENRDTSADDTITLTDTNTRAITSPNVQMAGSLAGGSTNDLQSSIGHYFTNCQIFDYTASAVNDAAVDIIGCKSVHFNSTPNFTMSNGQAGTRYFRCRHDSTNGGGLPVDMQFHNTFYHESSGGIALYLSSSITGVKHQGCRGASGGVVCATGIDIAGTPGSGEHNIIEAELFDGSAVDVDVLGFTEVYVNTSFSVSDFFNGNVYIPDGGATITITDPTRFNGAIYYQDGTEYRPNQGWVKAHQTSDATNVTGAGTVYTIPFATEVKDTQDEFSTPTFTAKYTGKYLVSGVVRLENLGADTFERASLTIDTTNRNYYFTTGVENTKDNDDALTIPFNLVCDMEATETLQVDLTVAGGTDVVTVAGAAVNAETWIDVVYIG